jgi:molybdenum cofactor biosynthesis enzyme MoaA
VSGSLSSVELGGNGFTTAQIASTLSSRFQQLILLPTEKCNFRCTYCYEDFKLGRMSESTQLGIERFIAKRISELSYLSLSWFGGEPLVAKDIVLRIASYASRLSKEWGVGFGGGLTTNGSARALVGKPRILILDEATASLDVHTEASVMQNLRSLGMTLIVISHRPEVWRFGDHVIEIVAGEVSQAGHCHCAAPGFEGAVMEKRAKS